MKTPQAYWRRCSGTRLYLTILLSLCALAPTASAAITGTVLDDGGNPVAAARVLISHSISAGGPHFTAPPTITGPLAATAVSDGKGNFTLADLAAGQYVACALTSAPGLLDPCHWAASAPTFTVVTGQPTTSVKIVMARGVVVPIHVADPAGLLSTSVTGPMDPDFQVHVVTGKGLHYNAPIQSQSAAGRDYTATIPYNTQVSIRVFSNKASVNQGGSAVPITGSPVAVPSGAAATPITFTVTNAVSVSPSPAGSGATGSTVSGAVKR